MKKIKNLSTMEIAIIKATKNHYEKFGDYDDIIKKLFGMVYGLNVEQLDSMFMMKFSRRLFFKLHPELNVLEKIEAIENDINNRLLFSRSNDPFETMLNKYLSEISGTQICEINTITRKVTTFIDLKLSRENSKKIKDILKVKDLSTAIKNNINTSVVFGK